MSATEIDLQTNTAGSPQALRGSLHSFSFRYSAGPRLAVEGRDLPAQDVTPGLLNCSFWSLHLTFNGQKIIIIIKIKKRNDVLITE